MKTKFDHPTQKPLELMRRPILNHTKRGEVVYDAFLGSGPRSWRRSLPSASAAAWSSIRSIVDVIVKRWQQFTGKEAILDGTERSFDDIAAERVPAVA